MSEKDDTDRSDNLRDHTDRTLGDVVGEKQGVLQDVFGLSPETARVTAEDSVADRMRQPSSDAKEGERISDAQESSQRNDD